MFTNMIPQRSWAIRKSWRTPSVNVIILFVGVLADQIQAVQLMEYFRGPKIITIAQLDSMDLGFVDGDHDFGAD